MKVPLFLASLVLLAAGQAAAQWQYPAYPDDRVQPRLEYVRPLPPYLAPRPAHIASRPVWYLPLGTTFKFREDRLVLPQSSKYKVGEGPLAAQSLHIAPSGNERVLSRDTQWTLKQVGAVWYRNIFGRDSNVYNFQRHQDRHRIFMLLESAAGTRIELEISPAGVTPSVGQFAAAFDIELPETKVVE